MDISYKANKKVIQESDEDFFRVNEVKSKMENKEVAVDVIIPTYRPDHKFDLLMKRLMKQTYQPKHVIILNTVPKSNSKEDELKEQDEFMNKYRELYHATIIHIDQEEFDHGGTRRYGASLATSDLLLFMTQDAIPADEFLIEELVKVFEDETIGAAYARQLAHTNADEIETYTRNFNYPGQSCIKSKKDMETYGIKTFYCSNVCAMYRRSVYEKLGGFVDKTIFNEDMIMASKIIHANYKIAYVAEAKVYHSHKYTYRQQFTRNFDLAVSQAQHAEVFEQVSSKSEGMRLVKNTANHLVKRHSYFKVVDLFFLSAFKYMGYFFGKRYEHIPKKLVKKMSMNKGYWK